jgi:sulfane dehydrogenase subunit SoxC
VTSGDHVKDPTPFIQHGHNLETRLESLTGFLTPNDLFFVRSSGPTPRLALEPYRLRVEGDAIERPLELTYEELLRLPRRTLIAYLDCAGNWRRFFQLLMGKPAPGTQWGTGGIGCAEWTGTSLARVLELAGVRADAVDVNLIGLDDASFSRPLPIAKALDENTLLAYRMNGETLPPDHGFPLRAVVPGWIGCNSIKWLGRIIVSSRKIWVTNNTSDYVLIGPEWPRRNHSPAEGAPLTTQSIKSALALPWPASLAPGRQRLRGIASSPQGPISQVQWNVDAATEWQPALLSSPALPYSWTWFEFDWDAIPGEHILRVRATDAAGNAQPLTVPFNEKGYLLNLVLPHPVRVA